MVISPTGHLLNRCHRRRTACPHLPATCFAVRQVCSAKPDRKISSTVDELQNNDWVLVDGPPKAGHVHVFIRLQPSARAVQVSRNSHLPSGVQPYPVHGASILSTKPKHPCQPNHSLLDFQMQSTSSPLALPTPSVKPSSEKKPQAVIPEMTLCGLYLYWRTRVSN